MPRDRGVPWLSASVAGFGFPITRDHGDNVRSPDLRNSHGLWLADLYFCFSQEFCRFFRWSRVNIKPCSPLKACGLRQLGNNLQVPVVKVIGIFLDGELCSTRL